MISIIHIQVLMYGMSTLLQKLYIKYVFKSYLPSCVLQRSLLMLSFILLIKSLIKISILTQTCTFEA